MGLWGSGWRCPTGAIGGCKGCKGFGDIPSELLLYIHRQIYTVEHTPSYIYCDPLNSYQFILLPNNSKNYQIWVYMN